MGLIDFIKNVGHKLNVGHEAPKPAQAAPKAAQGPSQQQIHDTPQKFRGCKTN